MFFTSKIETFDVNFHINSETALENNALGLLEGDDGNIYYRYVIFENKNSVGFLACVSDYKKNILRSSDDLEGMYFREFTGKLILAQ